MKFKCFNSYRKYWALSFIPFLAIACRPEKSKDQHAGKYLLIINGEKGNRDKDRAVWFNSLDSGTVINAGDGADISGKLGSAVILRDSFALSLDKKTGILQKFAYTQEGITAKKSLKLQGFEYISYAADLDSGRMLISGRGSQNISRYAMFDTKSMQLLKTDSFKLPVAKGQSLSDNFGVLSDKRFYVGYSSFGADYDQCSDTSYFAVLDPQGMRPLSVSRDIRSAFPGAGVNGMFSFFKGAYGDLYVLTSPVFYHGNHPTAPTAFYRVGKGKASFDKDYFFNLSEKLQGMHLLGIAQAGPGKVILATISYPSTGRSDFYLADVHKQTLRLLLKDQFQPSFVWGTSGGNIEKQAYFIVNGSEGTAQLYLYDALSDTLKKGALIKGEISPKSSYLLTSPK
ncbi:hypothetical protein D3C87_326860 [compost metagenome]